MEEVLRTGYPPEEEEREIDLKQLLIVVLRKWRIILLVTLLSAVAGAIYGYRPVPVVVQETASEPQTKDAAVESGAKTAEEYEKELKNYQAELAYYNEMSAVYQKWIDEDQAKYDEQSVYLQESFLNQVDPYHVAYSVADIFITKKETESFRPADGTLKVLDRELLQILRMYQSSLTGNRLLEECANQLETQPQYIREVLSCSVSTDYGYISLSVTGIDHAFTETVLETLLSHLDEIRTEVNETLATEHEAEATKRDQYYAVNKSFISDQAAAAQAQFNQAKRIADNRLLLDQLEKPVMPLPPSENVADALKEEIKQELPPAPVTVQERSLQKALKYAVIGAAGGCFLSLFLLAVYYVLTNRPLSAGEIARRYRLRTIGVIPGVIRNGNALDKKLSLLGEDKTYLTMTPEEQISVACANLSVYAPGEEELLLVSSAGEEQLRQLADTLHTALPETKFSCAANINEDAASMEMLKKFRRVILVEAPLQSGYARIDREMRLLFDWKKELTGFIGAGGVA